MFHRYFLTAALLVGLAAGLYGQDDVHTVRREAMIARIDQLLDQRLQDDGVVAAPLADDSEFLRRVVLDLTGVIPRVSRIRQFLKDGQPDKRQRLVEQLLRSPAHSTHMASTWRNIMLPRGFEPDQLASAAGLQGWFREQFVNNMRYDRIVSEFLVATGDGQTGPSLFYTSLEVQPEKLAASTSRIFLGTQIECAQCHDHPFDHWTQKDFWGYAAFFARLQQSGQQGMQVSLRELDEGDVTLPDSEEIVLPKYPGGRPADAGEGGTRRSQLSIWMASRDNPFLARAAVNRLWAQMFGRGLVEPVDDFGPRNPPSHPELLDELSAYFARSGFDLRELFRTLALTKAYQRSSQTVNDPPAPAELFSRMAIKTLTPEQLYDSLSRLMMTRPPAAFPGAQATSRLFDPRRQAFVAKMQSPNQSSTSYEAGVPQALTMLNGLDITEATDLQRGGLLTAIEAPFMDTKEKIDVLFLATLSRLPGDDERELIESYIDGTEQEENASRPLSDVLWAILNSAEFAMNH